jgi:DNA-binding Xre family transcriptional regulator
MTGQELKAIIDKSGVRQVEIARRLGMSHQNFTALFITKDVKSGTLEKICRAIDRDMSMFYPTGTPAAVTVSGSKEVAVNNSQVNSEKLIEEVAAQRRLTETALQQNNRLLAIIENMQK